MMVPVNPAIRTSCNESELPAEPSTHSENIRNPQPKNLEPSIETFNRNQTLPLLPLADETDHFPPLPSLSSSHHENQKVIPPSETNPWTKPIDINPRPPRKVLLHFIPPVPRGNDVIGVCSAESVSREIQILDNTVVGFFLGRRPSFSFVRANLLKQWNLRGSVEILQLLHGGTAFRFSAVEDREMVIDEGMYYVGGQPIFLRPWERNLHTGSVMGLKKVPLWVSLPGLPLHLWGEDSLSAICSVLGKPMFTDHFTASKSRWAFARACVEFSGDKPLLDTVMIEDDDGNIFHQPVKYSWRPPQCLVCGIFGHELNACKSSSSTAEEENPVAVHSDIRDPVENRRSKETQISSFLQARSTRNLLGRKPSRVRTKMHSGVPQENPTRVQTHLSNSEMRQAADCLSASPTNPPTLTPDFLPAGEDFCPSRQHYSNCSESRNPVTTSNQFEILNPFETKSDPSNCPVDVNPFTSETVSSPNPISSLPPVVGSNLNRSHNPRTRIPKPNHLTLSHDPGLQPNDPPLPRTSQACPDRSPSSVGHTPHPIRGSSFSRTMHVFNRPSPLSRSPFAPSCRKQFQSITPGDLEALMAPTPEIMNPDFSEEGDHEDAIVKKVSGGIDEAARSWYTEERKKNPELDLTRTARAVETWEDLEASLRDPMQFFYHADKDPI